MGWLHRLDTLDRSTKYMVRLAGLYRRVSQFMPLWATLPCMLFKLDVRWTVQDLLHQYHLEPWVGHRSIATFVVAFRQYLSTELSAIKMQH